MARIITVFGATGTQGGSVIAALKADGSFVPRAVTRNRASEAAQKLTSQGVEVVQADLWDKASLSKALVGSEGVFGVTNFYDPSIIGSDPQGEIDQGIALVDACRDAEVKLLVWSSLQDPRQISNGKYNGIHHCNNKAEIQQYLVKSGLPHAVLYTGWFIENLYNFGNLQPSDNGFNITVPRFDPKSPQGVLWVEKGLGESALALFKNYDSPTFGHDVLGGEFVACTARMTYPALAEILQKALGKPVGFVSPETCGLEELDEMYEFQSTHGLYSDVELPDPKLLKLGAKFGTLEEFAETRLKAKFA